MEKKFSIEVMVLGIFTVLFLWCAIAKPMDNKIIHEFPYGYLASDSVFHASTTEWMMDADQVKYAAPYMMGHYTDVLDIHPPFFFEITGAFGFIGNINAYDASPIMAGILITLVALLTYVIIRRINNNVAMISLALPFMIFLHPFSQVFTFGQWLFISSFPMMIATIWTFLNIKEKGMEIIAGIFLSATALAHQPQFAYLFGIIAILFVKEFKKEDLKKDIVKYSIIGLIVILLSGYSLLIFYNSWLQNKGVEIEGIPLFQLDLNYAQTSVEGRGFSDITIENFGLIAFVIIAGMVLAGISLSKNKRNEIISLFFLFAISMLVYFGFGKRAFAHRWFWPITLMYFLGFAIYFVVKRIEPIKNYTGLIAAFLIVFSFFVIQSKVVNTQGMIDQYSWDSFRWIKDNLQDKEIYYFWDDAITQGATRYLSGAVAFRVNTDQYRESLTKQTIFDKYKFRQPVAYANFVCEKGFLKFGWYEDDVKKPTSLCGDIPITVEREIFEKSICDLEYTRFAIVSQQPAFAEYNKAIVTLLLKNSWIKIIHQNPAYVLLKNEKPGVDCIELPK